MPLVLIATSFPEIFEVIHVCVVVLSVHAAVIAINDAIDHQVASATLEALRNPNAHLVDINAENADELQGVLYEAKSTKAERAFSKVCCYCNCY